jgi:hypothetical protein
VANALKSGRYRVVKGYCDITTSEESASLVAFYAIIDNGSIYSVQCRLVEEGVPFPGIRGEWTKYIPFVLGSDVCPSREVLQNVISQALAAVRPSELLETNGKAARDMEAKLNDYGTSALKAEVHAFVRVENAADDEIRPFLPSRGAAQSPEEGEASSPEGAETGEGATEEKESVVYVNCTAIIDPLKGKAANRFKEGEMVVVKLPEESVLYSLISKARKGLFDGKVEGRVLRVEARTEESTLMELEITKGFRGLLSAQNSLMLRQGHLDEGVPGEGGAKKPLPPAVFFGILAGVLVMVLFFIYRFLF